MAKVVCCLFVSDTLCAAGRPGCWSWLQGDFHLVHVVNQLCTFMSKDKWQDWLGKTDLQVHIMNQLVAHSVCRVPITRQESVPGSAAAGATVTWQDLENDGIAYISEPGMQSGSFGFASGHHCWVCCSFTLAPDLLEASVNRWPSCILQCWRLGLTLHPPAS